jgi:hypothetical protein
MRSGSLDKMTNNELVREFARTAYGLGDAVNNWRNGVAETRRLFTIRNILRARGRDARSQLMPLLEDADRFVRYYAAGELLALAPERSRRIIEENAKMGDAIAGDAGMLLDGLEDGSYAPV